MASILKSLAAFAKVRLKQPTTYIGLGALAVSLGAPAIVGSIGQTLGLIVGGGLVAVNEGREADAL